LVTKWTSLKIISILGRIWYIN